MPTQPATAVTQVRRLTQSRYTGGLASSHDGTRPAAGEAGSQARTTALDQQRVSRARKLGA
ncbi:hypothetical protein, partial [Gordonia effusa]|uniref:hypothetical protein n=1 Tax=Gordonia effusa TaxID=263908 RepID=UPI001B8B7860